MAKHLKSSEVMRYHGAMITLHWLMAIAIILMLTLGLIMTEGGLEKAMRFQLYQWHKSLGVILLWAVVLRLILRQLTTIPALPEQLSKKDKYLAKLGHVALYGWMFLLPFSGWLLVSSSVYGLPTMVFGWFEWPHFPGVASNKQVHEVAEEAHELLAYSLIALLVLHVLAVVKHRYMDHINILPRMGIGKQSFKKDK